MVYSMHVNVVKSEQALIHYGLNYPFTETALNLRGSLIVLEKFVNTSLHVLEDEEQLVTQPYDFFESYHIRVPKSLQGFDFSKGSAFFPSEKLPFHFLDRDVLPGVFVLGESHRPESPVPNRLNERVFIH